MITTRTALALALLAGSLILGACGAPLVREQPVDQPTAGAVAPSPAPSPEENQMSSDLAGTSWLLTDLNGSTPISTSVPTIEFEADRAAGMASCNRYFGGYSVAGASIAFNGFGSTMMACPDEVMQQEQAFLDTLNRATSFVIDGDTLTFTTDSGEQLVFARAA